MSKPKPRTRKTGAAGPPSPSPSEPVADPGSEALLEGPGTAREAALSAARAVRSSQIANLISALALIVTIGSTVQGGCDRAKRTEEIERGRQSQAFILGRRASVYEAQAISNETFLAAVLSPKETRPADSVVSSLNQEIAGNDMAIAAAPLHLNVSAREPFWRLDTRIGGQLHDTYSSLVVDAYNVGRMLGRYDTRACIVVTRTTARIEFKTCPELARSDWHREWVARVDTLVNRLGLTADFPHPDSASVYVWCSEARKNLDLLGAQLAGLAENKSSAGRRSAAPEDLRYDYMVAWDRGVWVPNGRTSHTFPSSFEADNYSAFDCLIGRCGLDWRPEFN